jgi:hypothetical protein
LTEQLESGIRSMEWDVRLRRGRFELSHVPIVDHAGPFTTPYYEADPTFQTQTMFPSVYASGVDRDYAAFVVHNTPDPEVIGGLVRAGFIVRTRIDTSLVFRKARFDDAWRNGAQILTSDFTIGRSDLPAAAVIYLPGGKLAVLRGER